MFAYHDTEQMEPINKDQEGKHQFISFNWREQMNLDENESKLDEISMLKSDIISHFDTF